MSAFHAMPLAGLRVLAVEDEALIAMMLETMLIDLGCSIVDVVGSVAKALNKVDVAAGEIDAAVLDVNIGGEKVFPVADALAAHDIPFIFCTGYGSSGLKGSYTGRIVLTKPYSKQALEAALAQTGTRPS